MLKISFQYIILFCLLAILFPYCYLSFFAQPIAEDFGFAAYFHNNTFIELMQKAYTGMNGRYISLALMFVGPLSFYEFELYHFIPIYQLIFFVLSAQYFIKTVYSCLTIERINISLIFTAIFLNHLPIISEGFFWYTGSVIYLTGLSICLIYFSFFIRQLINNKNKIVNEIICGFLLFLLLGFNEVLTLVTLFILTTITIFHFINKSKKKKFVTAQLIFALAFSCILFFAPGNGIRSSMYDNNHDFIHSVLSSILQLGRFSLIWVFSLPVLFASVLIVYKREQIKQRLKFNFGVIKISPIIILLIIGVVVFLCVFPAYWSTGILGQHRTLNIAYFFFIPLWFMFVLLVIKKYRNRLNWLSSKVFSYKIWIFLFLMSLAFTHNGYNGLKDIFSGSAKEFSNTLEKRHAVLFEAQTTNPKEIIFTPLPTKPITLFVTDISEDPGFWTNLGYNEYFNLNQTNIYIDSKALNKTN